MIKIGRSKHLKVTAGKLPQAHSSKKHKKINANISRNYALMLQLYIISRDEKLQKQKQGPVLRLPKTKRVPALSAIRSNLTVAMFRPLFQKLNGAKSRIYSAIELSYQSLIG